MEQLLKDQIVLITGGTAGIGKAIALKFAEQGAQVVIFGTSAERGAQVVKEILEVTKRDCVTFHAVDVSKTQLVEDAIKKVLAQFPRIDVVVNNAGVTRDQLLIKMTEEDWDTVIDVNVKSLYNMCRALVRVMLKARKGKIINISSVIGLTGNAGQVNYAASKAAIMGFTKALAKELASRNICVNCIAPGFIETRMTEILPEDQKKTILSTIPLGRMGSPADIANTALFLASGLSDYITGQVITVDGGMVMA